MKKFAKLFVLAALILLLFTGVASAQTWVVTSAGDTANPVNVSAINQSNMTLREAIAIASSGDTIVFADNITSVVVTNGTLNITKDLTIGGSSHVIVARNTSAVTREMSVFTVTSANVTFRYLTIENGLVRGTGGGVMIDRSNVTFNSCIIRNNRADTGGGVFVANGSNVTFISSSLFRNNGTTDGSAIYIQNGRVELQNSFIDGHSSRHSVVQLSRGELIASWTQIANNAITVGGSLINASSGTTVEFRNSTFSNNTATGGSAGIATSGTLLVENCVFDRGTSSGNGGGIDLRSGSVGTVRYSIFSNANLTGDGGGININAGAAATIHTCTFLNNTANYGGAIFNRGAANITAMTAVNNTARSFGGAIASWNDGNLTLTRSVLAGNEARSNNTPRETGGGGLNVSNSRAVLSNNVIVGNNDPRNVDLSERNATIQSGGNNLVGVYNGTGRFPIAGTDDLGILAANVFVIENGLPLMTRTTGHTAGFDRVTVFTVALNSSPNNPAADVLGVTDPRPPETPAPPPTPPELPSTPDDESGSVAISGMVMLLLFGVVAFVLLIIISIAVILLLLRHNEKRKKEIG